jgi:hypothetical protein
MEVGMEVEMVGEGGIEGRNGLAKSDTPGGGNEMGRITRITRIGADTELSLFLTMTSIVFSSRLLLTVTATFISTGLGTCLVI